MWVIPYRCNRYTIKFKTDRQQNGAGLPQSSFRAACGKCRKRSLRRDGPPTSYKGIPVRWEGIDTRLRYYLSEAAIKWGWSHGVLKIKFLFFYEWQNCNLIFNRYVPVYVFYSQQKNSVPKLIKVSLATAALNIFWCRRLVVYKYRGKQI